MPKANKSAKAPGKAAIAKPSEDQPVLRAIKGGKAAPKPAKPTPLKATSASADDVPVIGLSLEPAKLSPALAAYFKQGKDKLRFSPNVLLPDAFDMRKLESLVAT